MRTKEEIRKEIDDCLKMIISNSNAIIGDETLTNGQIHNLHLANQVIKTRVEALGWVIGETLTLG